MPILTPKIASVSAYLAYDTEFIEPELVRFLFNSKSGVQIKNHFDILSGSLLKGTSGAGGFVKESGFGAVFVGKNRYKNNFIISIRGTAGLADAITDLNAGMAVSAGNRTIHSGFSATFSSILQDLKRIITPLIKIPGATFHCVGHSLGGALATLTAEWLKVTYGIQAYLYTFGCPRVGFKDFSLGIRSACKAEFRATHGGDPVTLIPVWPFMHSQSTEYRLDNGLLLWPGAHKMGEDANPGYLNTANRDEWQNINRHVNQFVGSRVVLSEEMAVLCSSNSHWANKIAAAINTFLWYRIGPAVAALQNARIGIESLYDLISAKLAEFADAACEFADEVRGILAHMLKFIGDAAKLPKQITYNYVRNLFHRMLRKLYDLASRAMQ
jgi:hypothetical protein